MSVAEREPCDKPSKSGMTPKCSEERWSPCVADVGSHTLSDFPAIEGAGRNSVDQNVVRLNSSAESMGSTWTASRHDPGDRQRNRALVSEATTIEVYEAAKMAGL